MMITQADIPEIIKSIPAFMGLKRATIDKLAALAEYVEIAAGETVFHEGDRLNCLYYLLDGQVAVDMLVPTRGNVRLYLAEPLDFFGISGFTPVVRQRTGTAVALTPLRVICFDVESLSNLCEQDHDLGYVLYRKIANLTASRLLVTRLCLMDIVLQNAQETAH